MTGLKKARKRPLNEQSALRLHPSCTHLAGEYFVAAELARQGYNVAMTVGNAKRVDIIVEHEGKTLPVQVKALASRRNVGWPVKPGHNYDAQIIFVCVVLGDVGTVPEYYVLDGAVVEGLKNDYGSRAVLNISEVKTYRDRWDLIAARLSSTT